MLYLGAHGGSAGCRHGVGESAVPPSIWCVSRVPLHGPEPPDDPHPIRAPCRTGKPVIGLTGGIGAGKSEAAAILAALGAAVIDADQINRRLLGQPAVRSELCKWWTDQILTAAGELDRRRIAEIVFADARQRARLEAYLHPLIDLERRRQMEAARSDGRFSAIVIDAPLLYEAGLDRECDAVIFIQADRPVREERVRRSRGWGPEELTRREKMQMDLELKLRRADYTCTNNSGRDALRDQLTSIYSRIVNPRRT